jgi:hypothetical protein
MKSVNDAASDIGKRRLFCQSGPADEDFSTNSVCEPCDSFWLGDVGIRQHFRFRRPVILA